MLQEAINQVNEAIEHGTWVYLEWGYTLSWKLTIQTQLRKLVISGMPLIQDKINIV